MVNLQISCEQFPWKEKMFRIRVAVTDAELIQSSKAQGARMSVKIHFLRSHLDYFPDNCGDYSEKQGERFHQDIRTMEERYQERWDINMLANYCWCLKRDLPGEKHKRKSLKKSFLPH